MEKTKGIASNKRGGGGGGIGRAVVMIVGNRDVSSLSRDSLLGSSALSRRERAREMTQTLYDLEIACLRVGCQLIINLLIHLSIQHTIR